MSNVKPRSRNVNNIILYKREQYSASISASNAVFPSIDVSNVMPLQARAV